MPSHQLVLEVSLERGDNCILSLHFEWHLWQILHLHRKKWLHGNTLSNMQEAFFACELWSHLSDHHILHHTRTESVLEVGLGLPVTVCDSLWGLKLQLKKYWKWGHYMLFIPPLPATKKIYFFCHANIHSYFSPNKLILLIVWLSSCCIQNSKFPNWSPISVFLLRYSVLLHTVKKDIFRKYGPLNSR